ncbi:CD22 protein, partial [Amia calva]|nr:CD22 protein [Amia calva]
EWVISFNPQSICTLEGSSVVMGCHYSYPRGQVTNAFWFVNSLKNKLIDLPAYKGRTVYLGNKVNCTNMLRYLTQDDGGVYKFRFTVNNPENAWIGKDQVDLSITDLQVKLSPSTMTEAESLTLSCLTSCKLSDPAFIWYRNGQPLNTQTPADKLTIDGVSYQQHGNYSCMARGYDNLPSPPQALSVRYAPKNTSVSVSPSGEIVEGSSVTLTCSSNANPPVQNYTWFKTNGAAVWEKRSGQSSTIAEISSGDSGQYYC